MHLPCVRVSFDTDDAKLKMLYDTAEEKCKNNLKHFGKDLVLVEGGGYEKIWLETQPMGGEMYFSRCPEAALNNQLLFMRTQRADGRLAGSIQCLPDGGAEPQFNKLQGFCFPAPALSLYYLTGRDRDYLDALAECLERFDAWLWRTRDSDGDGCLESFCVYDTGEDNALRYGDAPNYCPTDAPPEGSRVVPLASMDVTSFSHACRDTLKQICLLRGDAAGAARWENAAAQVRRALKSRLWDEAKGALFDRDRTGRTLPTLVHNSLRCMYWRSLDASMAERFVREHLLNPGEFDTPLPLPSVSVSDPLFRNAPENNWSGQCEGLTYQRALDALENYGYTWLLPHYGRKLLKALIDGGYVFTQQFDPFTAAPSRVGMISHRVLLPGEEEPFQDSYGPTLLSALEYIARLYGVRLWRDRVWFGACAAPFAYDYTQTLDDRVYRLVSDGKTAEAFLGNRRIAAFPCGWRAVTDADGVLLDLLPLEAPSLR